MAEAKERSWRRGFDLFRRLEARPSAPQRLWTGCTILDLLVNATVRKEIVRGWIGWTCEDLLTGADTT